MDRKLKYKLERLIKVLESGEEAGRFNKKKSKQAKVLNEEAIDWLSEKSVQGISIGTQQKSGKDTGKPCITVYVDKKKPLSQLKHPVPKKLTFDGRVDIDVIEIGRLLPQAYSQEARPLHPSLHLANINRGGGSLGAFVKLKGSSYPRFIISNHHVLAPKTKTDRSIIQPSKEFGKLPYKKVARYTRSYPMTSSQYDYQNLADAAIAEVSPNISIDARLPRLGQILGVSDRVSKGQRVSMVGSISDFKVAKVINSNFRMVLYYDTPKGKRRVGFKQQVLCTPYSQAGDSGALVLNNRGYAIGLHVAGNSKHSIFCRLSPVLEEFGCELILKSTPKVKAVSPVKAQARKLIIFDLPKILFRKHNYNGSQSWRLTKSGLEIKGIVKGTKGEPITVAKVWDNYGPYIKAAAKEFSVPCELILATICTETNGKSSIVREEPGYQSDYATPFKVSVGIMQTLIGTAQESLDSIDIDRKWLLQAENSIRAGTSYIKKQLDKTMFDPPKVACAYNAGGVYDNNSAKNSWRMRQYPIGTGHHADRFCLWFNDCFRVFSSMTEKKIPEYSFYKMLEP